MENLDGQKKVLQYINSKPENIKQKLIEMRNILLETCPNAKEDIKWGTASFSLNCILFTYAGYKNHIGFYPTPSIIKHFENKLIKYKIGKGSIQFSLDEKLPKNLIKNIAELRIKDVVENGVKWM